MPVAELPPRPGASGTAATAKTGTYRFIGLSEAFLRMMRFPGIGPLLTVYTGWLVIPIVHYAYGGNRGETLRQIRSLRSQIQENLRIDIDGPLYRRWCEARQETVRAYIGTIEAALRQMGKEGLKPSAPEQLGAELERQQREIDVARASLAEWLNVSWLVYGQRSSEKLLAVP
jgi:hypothetical protein